MKKLPQSKDVSSSRSKSRTTSINNSFKEKTTNNKKSIYNISTIFQMNNLKKDYKNIFNNELIASENKNKNNENYEFIIPLNNSIDEKIGLDKIEFIDQRIFENLNTNNLEALNKRTTAEHTNNSNSNTVYASNIHEKTEKINFELNFTNANEDCVNMKSNKKNSTDFICENINNNNFNFFDFNNFNNLNEKNLYEKNYINNININNNSNSLNNNNLRKLSDNNAQNEKEENFVKVKNHKPSANLIKFNNQVNNEIIDLKRKN